MTFQKRLTIVGVQLMIFLNGFISFFSYNGWYKWLAGFTIPIFPCFPDILKAGDFQKTALPASPT